MTLTHFDDQPDQQTRIEKMREEIERLGGTLSAKRDLPADLEEEFLKQVLACETAESNTLFQWLENAGLGMPPPESLDDGAVSAKLWEVIERMASLGAYLLNTNHLTDRGLYEYLYAEGLREEAMLFPENPSYAYMIDLTGSGSEEDMQLYLRYYADDQFRLQWAKDWPDDPMPEREEPPYERDRNLPRSHFG